MEAVTTRAAGLVRAETLVVAALAAAAAVAVAAFAPPGGDAAAHLYRTELVRDGVRLWDNLWYGGHYPLTSYSLLYYLAAAAVGNLPLVLGAAVASAVLFESVAADEWGEDAARWPARAFAVVAAGPVFTGTYTFALGVAAGLAAVRLAQLGRRWPAVACAALALGFSPLAFVFLALVLGAALTARRRLSPDVLVLGASLALLALLQLLVVLVFPSSGRYSFSLLSLAGVLALAALGAALAARSGRAQVLVALFVLWGLANLVSFAVPSPFGDNLARLRHFVLPLVLLAAVLARFRPRPLAAAALAVALVYNLGPDVSAAVKRAGDRSAEPAYWAPALAFLHERMTPDHRVAVVPLFSHYEAYYVPRSGFALARGWYRQIDIAENPELYRRPLTREAYRRWLKRLGVRYVLLPSERLGPMGADREAELLRSGEAGLPVVWRTRDWTVYEDPTATPIITGAAGARVETLGHTRIAATVDAPGVYRLRVRHTPYWRVAAGAVCVERAPDGMTRIVAREAGRFVLAPPAGASGVLRAAFRDRGSGCR
ncbi:MAG TPA: hypothetical protein VM290_12095 [Gaiellaceae bacterium]|nr:hypothetical protein [Gaiellaceae bacterium]